MPSQTLPAGPQSIGAQPWRIKLKFGEGSWGWTETYWWASGLNTAQSALNAAVALGNQRVQLLFNQAVLQAFAIAPPTGPFGPFSQYDWANGFEALTGTQGVLPVWTAALCDAWDVSRTYHRRLMLRGLPTSAIGQPTPTGQVLFSGLIQGPLLIFCNFLATIKTLQPQASKAGLPFFPTWCIRAPQKTIAGQMVNQVFGGSVDGSGCVLTINTNGAYTYPIGQTVLMRRIHRGTGGLLHGTGVVTGVTGPVYTVTTKGRCCCGPDTIRPGGTLAVTTPLLWSMDIVQPNRIITRHTGKPFFGTLGRRTRCKC